MKKTNYIILSALASTLALVSCSDQTEGTSTAMENEIQITAMMGSEVSSRAISSETVTTADISTFYMNAYSGSDQLITIEKSGDSYTTGKFTPKSGTVGSLEGTEVWSDGRTTPYYWPAGSVKFMAIACSDGTEPAIAIASDELSMTDFQVEDASTSSYNTQKDYIAAVTTQSASTSKTVSLHFQHLLSRLSINMWAPADKFQNTSKLEVVGFRFESVNVKGSFSYAGESTQKTSDTETGNFLTSNWTPDATAGSGNVGVAVADDAEASTADVWGLAAEISKATELQNSGSKLSNATPWLNVVPGSNVANKLVVYIKLTPTDTNKAAYYKSVSLSLTDTENASVITTSDDGASTPAYLPGYQYIYNLKVLGQDNDEGEIEHPAIELQSISVKPWNDQLVGNIESSNVGDNALREIFQNAENYSQINLKKNVILCGTKGDGYTYYSYNYPIAVTGYHTLNLAGFNITVNDPTGETAEGGKSIPTSVFTIAAGGRLVITDETSGGMLTNNYTSATLFDCAETAKVIIRGGKFSFDPSAYIEGTPDNDAFSETVTTKTFTENYTDDSTGKAMVRTTVVTLASGVYAVSQTITNKE